MLGMVLMDPYQYWDMAVKNIKKIMDAWQVWVHACVGACVGWVDSDFSSSIG